MTTDTSPNQYLGPENAQEYLRRRGHVMPEETVQVRPLSGGVSNVVLHVTRSQREDFVLKQALPQLQVAEPWYCSVERIWREAEVLQLCQKIISFSNLSGVWQPVTPKLLFEDREQYLFAMTAAGPGHVVWKNELLAGRAEHDIAAACGDLLGRLHAATWHDSDTAKRLDDRQYFDDLRLDPYYRQLARVHNDLSPAIDRLIQSVLSQRHSLVHGDFSPKNMLLYDHQLMLIDFEVGHYGDPAFDLGFFLTHLVLKAFCHTPQHEPFLQLTVKFWDHYQRQLSTAASQEEYDALVQRAILNTAGCAMARIDGKSQVDYLSRESQKEAVRQLCRALFAQTPANWSDVLELSRRYIHQV